MGREQVDCHEPLAKRHLRTLKDGADLHSELLLAPATGEQLAVLVPVNLQITTPRTSRCIAPADFLKMLSATILVREVVEQVY